LIEKKILNEELLRDKLFDTFRSEIEDLDAFYEFSDNLVSKTQKIIDKINSLMDSLLDIKTIDRWIIDANDWDQEFKVVNLISDKLNQALSDLSWSEKDLLNNLYLKLDDIWKQVELTQEEQWYYQEFKDILFWSNSNLLVQIANKYRLKNDDNI